MPQQKKTLQKTKTTGRPVSRSATKPVSSKSKTIKSAKTVTKGKLSVPQSKKAAAAKAKPIAQRTSIHKAAAAALQTKRAAVQVVAAKAKVAAAKVVAATKTAAKKPAAPVIVAKPAKINVAALVAAALPKAPVAAAKSVPAAVAKQSTQRITAPVAPKIAPVDPRVAAAAAAAAIAAKKPVSARHGFKPNEFIVYPAHGVGRIVGIEEQEIAGMTLELFVITFEKDKMTLRVPTGKLQSVGMRKLADESIVKRAMETLKGRARVKRTMWSRRAQEYEAKINSGDLISIAEVVRDLYRSETQPEQSYSERQLYEAALDRMAREIAAVDKIDERGAVQRITEVLSKSAKGRRAAEEAAIVEDDTGAAFKAA